MNDVGDKSDVLIVIPKQSQSVRSKLRYLLLGLITVILVIMFALYYHASLRLLMTNEVQTTDASDMNTNEVNITNITEPMDQSAFMAVLDQGYRHVLPRAAYLDQRRIHGHKNAVVILAQITKEVLTKKLVLHCVVNGMHTKNFRIQSFLMNNWIHGNHPHLTYDNVMIFCYDATVNRDDTNTVIIEYKNPKDNKIISIKPEEALFVPSFQPANKGRSSVMVCITAFGNPPCMNDWLRYQKTLGVDLVYINAQDSFLNSTAYSDAFFQESVDNGFVQVKVWKEHLTKMEIFYHSQLLYYHDCLYRFQSVYDYAFILDTDEFYVVKDGKIDVNIHKHLDTVFSQRSKVGALRLEQVIYRAPPGGFNRSNTELNDNGNLPRYAVRTSLKSNNFKSVSRLSTTVELSVHTVVGFMPGFREYPVPKHIAHVAHMK